MFLKGVPFCFLLAAGVRGAAAIRPRDACADISQLPLVFSIEGVSTDFGSLPFTCLCISQMSDVLSSNLIANQAVEAVGQSLAATTLENMILTGPACSGVALGTWSQQQTLLSLQEHACPEGLTRCSAPSFSYGLPGWQCVDSQTNLESCGGCPLSSHDHEPAGVDCTAIRGAEDVSCRQGRCEVRSCATGYEISQDGHACLRA